MSKLKYLGHKYYTANLVKKRLPLLVGARYYRDKKKIDEAIENVSKIRKRITKKSKNFNGVGVIRKWRDERGQVLDTSVIYKHSILTR